MGEGVKPFTADEWDLEREYHQHEMPYMDSDTLTRAVATIDALFERLHKIEAAAKVVLAQDGDVDDGGDARWKLMEVLGQ